MSENKACDDCKAHGAMKVRVGYAEEDNKNQWKEINEMKRFVRTSLVSSILSLLGIIVLLVIQLFRAYGKVP